MSHVWAMLETWSKRDLDVALEELGFSPLQAPNHFVAAVSGRSKMPLSLMPPPHHPHSTAASKKTFHRPS
ncbi:hypothetical protein PIB30_087685 [Stylosanthes scabra]|uniref:Uncharacterized protein n=1 Tax=Stylosanthes scabra TaxID=79078 RepID=A0ABU6TUW8_9FABA|nr:hypothetical protein [Stylosanthes scabra]